MTNSQIQAGLENGTIAAGTGMILYPDGKLMTNEGNVILPASPDRKAIYDSQVENNIPAKVVELEDAVDEIEESVSTLNDAVNSKCADIVIKLDKSVYSTLADSDLHLISGSYSDANEKLTQGIPLTALVYSYHIEGTEHIMNVYPTAITAYTGYSEFIQIFALDGSGEYHVFYLSESGLSVNQPE